MVLAEYFRSEINFLKPSHCLEKREEVLGESHPDTLMVMSCLADTLSSLGDLDSAESLHSECFMRRLDTLGSSHPDTIASFDALTKVQSGTSTVVDM